MNEALINKIIELVGIEFDVPIEAITSKTHRRHCVKVVEAKQVTAHLIWRFTECTSMQIASAIDGASKQYIGFCKRQVRRIAGSNKVFREKLAMLESTIEELTLLPEYHQITVQGHQIPAESQLAMVTVQPEQSPSETAQEYGLVS